MWIGTRIRSNVPGAPGTRRMRRVHLSVEGDRRASSRRHPPSCATRQPAWGKANESRIGDTAKRATGEKLGSSFPNWAAWHAMLWNISFLDFRKANGCGARYTPLKTLLVHPSPLPLITPHRHAQLDHQSHERILTERKRDVLTHLHALACCEYICRAIRPVLCSTVPAHGPRFIACDHLCGVAPHPQTR